MQSIYDIYTTSQSAWDAMKQAIQQAKKSIYWEVYIFLDDEIGASFFDILEQKAREGVKVKLIIDSWGSFWFAKRRVESLKAAGVDILFFHERKKKFRGLWRRQWSRTHRKILVVDEQIGFIGGVNVQKQAKDWNDIHVRLEGKVVRSLLRSFAKMYIICGGDKEQVQHLLKYSFRAEHSKVDFVYDDGFSNSSQARKKYIEALVKARERVILFSPYYFPDREFLKALWNAKKRGVRVDLLIPFRTDLRIASLAAYFWFTTMKKFGVKIHLLKNMMHGKGVIVDDDWAMVGSSNLDHTSFYDCYEANIQIRDKEFVKRLKYSIETWFQNSLSLDDVKWEKRSWWQKVKEWLAYKLYTTWHRRAKFKLYDPESRLHSTAQSNETTKS